MTTARFFPYLNECEFLDDEKRILLKVAMKTANKYDLFDFLASNRDGYCCIHVIRKILPISQALENECANIVDNDCGWTQTYFQIIGMLEYIARNGFHAFAARFNEINEINEINDTDDSNIQALFLSQDFYLGQSVLVRMRSTYTWTRGKIVEVLEFDEYVVAFISNGEKITVKKEDLRKFNAKKIDLPLVPDFSFIKDVSSKQMIESGYKSVTTIEGWNLLREFTGESFIWSNDPKTKKLMNAVCDDYSGGHSGGSMGWTIRILERISHVGINIFKNEWLK